MSRAVADAEGLIGKTLRKVELFASWSDDALETMADAASLRQYNKGEVVIEARSPATGIFVIVRGALLNCRSWESGKYMLMSVVHPNWPLKIAAAWDGYEMPHGLTARRDSLVLHIPRDVFIDVVKSDTRYLSEITTFLCHQLRGEFSRINVSAVGSLRLRVAVAVFLSVLNSLILIPEAPERVDVDDDNIGDTDLTQEELAAMAGHSRQRVNGVLRQMEREGMLRRRGRKIEVANYLLLKDALEEEDPLNAEWVATLTELQARLEASQRT